MFDEYDDINLSVRISKNDCVHFSHPEKWGSGKKIKKIKKQVSQSRHNCVTSKSVKIQNIFIL